MVKAFTVGENPEKTQVQLLLLRPNREVPSSILGARTMGIMPSADRTETDLNKSPKGGTTNV